MNDHVVKLDRLLEQLNVIEREYNSLNFHKEDVRKSFFALYSTVVRDFYNGRISFLVSEMIANGKIQFKSDTIEYASHLVKFSQKSYVLEWMHGYLMLLNRNLINNSWTSFETCISLVYNEIISEKEKEKIHLKKNEKLIKLIKSIDGISVEKSDQIIQVIVKNDFTPLIRKFRKIVNKEKYERDYQYDLNFLFFANNIRNCMLHTNGIYLGKRNFIYNFRATGFKFENNQMFKVINDYDLLYLDITLELKSIFLSTVNSIEFEDLIPYPEDYNN